jgi:hypothetical protein
MDVFLSFYIDISRDFIFLTLIPENKPIDRLPDETHLDFQVYPACPFSFPLLPEPGMVDG